MLYRGLFSILALLGLACLGRGDVWDLRDTAQPGQRTLYAAIAGGGFYGMPVGAGDLNGDGFGDVVLCPMRATGGPGNQLLRPESGETYIVFGDGVVSGTLELSQLPLAGVVEIIGASNGDLTGCELTVLDWNGDGIDDLALCAQNHSGPPEAPRFRAGAVALILGASQWPARIDLSEATHERVIWIYGEEPTDRLGVWARAGHVDDDGRADLLIGADQADGPGNARPNVGEAYLIYGASPAPARIDLASRDGLRITHVSGYDAGDHFGGTVYLGDVDADGRDDLIISAASYRFSVTIPPDTSTLGGGDGQNNDVPEAGEAVIIFSSPELPAELHLSQLPHAASVTRIFGFDAGDYLGEETSVGDLNGDGHPDFAMGSLRSRGADNSSPLAGEAHIFYGPIPRGVEFVANAPIPGVTHTVIYARAAGDITGDTFLIFDLNRDGFDDFILGSPCGLAAGSRIDGGIVDVFFGQPEPFPPVILLANKPATPHSYEIWGADEDDGMCYSAWWEEFDGDGYPDPLINAMRGDRPGTPLNDDAGEVYALSGYEIARRAGALTQTPTPTPTATTSPTFTPTPTATTTPTPTVTTTPSYLPADLDRNGIVDQRDLLLFIQSWHRTN
ncbi:FG-GAP repeat protein [bacterium]|nr:FG-GAP repeat protein [bacterium]